MNHAMRRLLTLLLMLSFCLMLLPGFALAEEPEGSIATVEDAEGLQDQSGVISAPEAENGEEILEITVWVDDVVAEHTRQLIQAYNEAHQGEPQFSATVLERPLADAYGNLVNDPESAADLFLFPQDQMVNILREGFLDRLDSNAAALVREKNAEGAVRAAEYRGDLYAYPITADNGFFLYYDRSVIPESDVDSLEAIIADCEAAGKSFFFDAESGWYFSSFFFATGCVSSWETEEENWICTDSFDSEQGLTAALGMKKLTDSQAFVNGSSAWDAFGEGNAAALVSGTWDYDTALEFLGDDLGATDLPSFTIDGQSYHMGSFSGSKLLGVKPQEDPDRSAALHDLARYLTGEEAQGGRFEAVHWGPSNLAAQQDPAVQEDPALAALLKQSAYATPQGPVFASWWNIAANLSRRVQHARTAEEIQAALDLYQQQIEDPENVWPSYAFGACGETLTWLLADNVLTISGSGEMWDWVDRATPWSAYLEEIRTVVIEPGATSIGNSAFFLCDALTRVTIPESVSVVGVDAFFWTGLTQVQYGGTREDWAGIEIGQGNIPLKNCAVICTDGILDNTHKCGENVVWSFEEDEGCLRFSGTGAMWDYEPTQTPYYDLHESVRSVVLEPGITSIGARILYSFENITELTVPDGVVSIGEDAFNGCKSLEEIRIPDSVRQIGNGAFYSCSALESIRIPEQITEIGEFTFGYCWKLTKLVIPEQVTQIGAYAFYNLYRLTSLTIPEKVTSIGTGAFSYCGGLKTLRFAGSAPSIGSDAFKGDTATVYYPAFDPSWTEEVRQNYSGTITWLPYVFGDANDDGKTDLLDLVRMRKYLAGLPAELIPICSDLNGDGEVSSSDLVRLRKLLVGAP